MACLQLYFRHHLRPLQRAAPQPAGLHGTRLRLREDPVRDVRGPELGLPQPPPLDRDLGRLHAAAPRHVRRQRLRLLHHEVHRGTLRYFGRIHIYHGRGLL